MGFYLFLKFNNLKKRMRHTHVYTFSYKNKKINNYMKMTDLVFEKEKKI